MNSQPNRHGDAREGELGGRKRRAKVVLVGTGFFVLIRTLRCIIRYAVDQATDGGMGATNRSYSTVRYIFDFKKRSLHPELHTVKTKPIARYRERSTRLVRD
jgi:hypothetical protein